MRLSSVSTSAALAASPPVRQPQTFAVRWQRRGIVGVEGDGEHFVADAGFDLGQRVAQAR
jgi:hypothetical protein